VVRPQVKVVTNDPDRLIGELTIMYRANNLQYPERYACAVVDMCSKYDVSAEEMNRMIADDTTMARGP